MLDYLRDKRPYRIATVDDILATSEQNKITLLLGAGCSASAGIPLAPAMAKEIKSRFPNIGAHLSEMPTYAECMGALVTRQRHEYVKQVCESAKINWAHIAIAQLLAQGIVDRVLTTNFDPLIVKACALLGDFPPVYDLAASSVFTSSLVAERAVFYLHGQYAGLVQVHTDDAFERVEAKLAAAVDASIGRRTWIVCGFSGESDPLLKVLAQRSFTSGLYWVGFEAEDPAPSVVEGLLSKDDCFLVKGFDADRFFMQLAQGKKVFPPEFVDQPFAALSRMIASIAPYKVDVGEKDFLSETRAIIRRAEKNLNRKRSKNAANINGVEASPNALLVAGRYDEVIARYRRIEASSKDYDEWRSAASWALREKGDGLLDEARLRKAAQADVLYANAIEKYREALHIDAQNPDALNNLGNALAEQARGKNSGEAQKLFRSAELVYRQALVIDPRSQETLHNLGVLHLLRAHSSVGTAKRRHYRRAEAFYRSALSIEPNLFASLWGLADSLTAQAQHFKEPDQIEKFEEAIAIYEQAANSNPTASSVHCNWATALSALARISSGRKANKLFSQASQKFAEALELKPNSRLYLMNWSRSLTAQAKGKTGQVAQRLLALAKKKRALATASSVE